MSIWDPKGTFPPAPSDTYPGGYSATPTPYRPPRPGGGFVIPPGAPPIPDRKDYPEGAAGTQTYQDDYVAWVDIIYALGGGIPEEEEAARGLTPEELALERERIGISREGLDIQRQGVQAQNLASFIDATIAAVDAQIEAGQLNLAQAQAEFDRRVDAFTAAGTQRAEMWKWTVPEGSAGQPLHPDIRGDLGMQPWISDPTTIDPFAEATQIVEEAPEIPVTPIQQDPLAEAVKLMEQFL